MTVDSDTQTLNQRHWVHQKYYERVRQFLYEGSDTNELPIMPCIHGTSCTSQLACPALFGFLCHAPFGVKCDQFLF